MASVKIILKTTPNKAGLYPLYIRVTQFRKSIRVSLDKSIPKSAWDGHRVKSTFQGAVALNRYLTHKYTLVLTAVMDYEIENRPITKKDLQELIKGRPPVTFYEVAQMFLDRYDKDKQYRVRKAIKSKLEALIEFAGSNFAFTGIDLSFLESYSRHLKSSGLMTNTVGAHMKVLRTFIRFAIKNGYMKAEDPFRFFQIKSEKSAKVPLTRDELTRIRKVHAPKDSWMYHAKNCFLFAFNTFGMRVSDLIQLRKDQIVGTRIHYTSSKSKDPFSIGLTSEASRIIQMYKTSKGPFVFPFLNSDRTGRIESTIDTTSTLLRKGLKQLAKAAGIEKPITTHTARHTFAQLAMEADTPDKVLQEMLGHEDSKTTSAYTHGFGKKRLDEINALVTAGE